MQLEIEGVIMAAHSDAGGCQDVTVGLSDWQDIRGFGFLAPLISHRLIVFLGNRVTAIQIQLRQVNIVVDNLNTGLPNLLQAPVSTPLLEVVAERLPTDLFLVGSSGLGSIGNRAH